MRTALRYREPLSWPATLSFFRARAIPGVETVDGDVYRRSIDVDGQPGLIEVSRSPRKGSLDLRIEGVDDRYADRVAARVRAIFDLDAPVGDIASVLQRDDALAARLESLPGPRVMGAWSGFELSVRAVLGQQVTVAAATTLSGRVARRYGEPLPSPLAAIDPGVDVLFPKPARLARARMNGMGIVGSRTETIRALARTVAAGDIDFDAAQDARRFRARLESIRGIGDWTSQYVSMRALRDPDAFPAGDLGLLKAVEPGRRLDPEALRQRAEAWRPWRAYAASLLWYAAPAAGG
ncbi:MAG: AlkA N-terminal domain-containing protein [Woeseiaceae bacterium]|nr:AlkA N-terminal domain-containing protein [Woeseiaceae bacterium]